ncbi:hypothetical protein [Aquifex pyrophilus]
MLTIKVINPKNDLVISSVNISKTLQENLKSVSYWYCKYEGICGFLKEALTQAVEQRRYALRNMFPVYGYIYRLMTHKKEPGKRIAFITLGREDGIKPGDTLKIVEFKRVKDPVTGRYFYEEYEIGECKVSSTKFEVDKSICVIDDMETAKKVRIKHAVKR